MLSKLFRSGLVVLTCMTLSARLSWADEFHAEISGAALQSLNHSAQSISKKGDAAFTELGEFHLGEETLHPIVQAIEGVVGEDSSTEGWSDQGFSAVPKAQVQTFQGTFAESSTEGKDFIRLSIIKDAVDGSQTVSGIMEREGQIFSLASEQSTSRLKDTGQASVTIKPLSERPDISSFNALATANVSTTNAVEPLRILTISAAVRSELYSELKNSALTEQQNIQQIRNKIIALFDAVDAYTQRDLNIKLSLIYQVVFTTCTTEACPYYQPIFSLYPLTDWLSDLRPRKQANWTHTFSKTASGGFGSSIFRGGACAGYQSETSSSFNALAFISQVTGVPKDTYRYYANFVGTLLNASEEAPTPPINNNTPYYFMTRGYLAHYPNTIDAYSPLSKSEVRLFASYQSGSCLASFGAPLITQEPTNFTVTSTSDGAAFTAKVKKGFGFTGDLAFQWIKDYRVTPRSSNTNGGYGEPIPGATSAQYDAATGEYTSQYTVPASVISSLSTYQAPAYWLKVTATSGGNSIVTESDPAVLRVKSPVLTLTSTNPSVAVGSTVTFTVTPVSGNLSGITYRWMKQPSGQSPQPASGSVNTTPSYTTPPLTAADDGAKYFVEMTIPSGTSLSNKIEVALARPCIPITINAQPTDNYRSGAEGVAVFRTEFTLESPGSFNAQTPIKVCWNQRRQSPDRVIEINCETNIGANILHSSLYTPAISSNPNPASPQTAPGIGVFARVSYGNCPAVDTNTATVNAPPSIASQPSNVTKRTGEIVTYSPEFQTWGFTTTYQWYKKRYQSRVFDLINGATQPTLSYLVRDGAATTVKVVAENAFGTIESDPATLTITSVDAKSLKSKKAKKKPIKRKPIKKKPAHSKKKLVKR